MEFDPSANAVSGGALDEVGNLRNTGIKAIDVLLPLERGGRAVFTDYNGTFKAHETDNFVLAGFKYSF